MGGIKTIYNGKNTIKRNRLVLFLGLIFLGSIIVSGAASAANVSSNQLNSVKIHTTKSTYSFQSNPSIDGTRVVWEQMDPSMHTSIYYKNMAGGKAVKVFPCTQNQYKPSISGTRVVWMQENSQHVTNIYYENLAIGKVRVVMPSSLNQTNPDISGSLIAWETWQNWIPQVSFKNMLTGANGKVKQLSGYSQYSPRVSGIRVVWSEGHTICIENLHTGTFSVVQKNKYWSDNPDISGMKVVWNEYGDYVSDPSKIYYKNLATGKSGIVGPSGGDVWRNFSPAISGNRVVWVQQSGLYKPLIVYFANLATGKYRPVSSYRGYQTNPAISGNIIVWEQTISAPATSCQDRIFYRNFQPEKLED